MTPSNNLPRVRVTLTPDYRENYANTVQIRPSTWDFLLQFGTMEPRQPDEVEMRMVQGIYLSPQQAKAVLHLLKNHIENYEKAFGEVQLQPLQPPGAVQ
ncbi:MAG TPA: DUF3467 domain-containing protein [Terriglobales bacterium]|jgi:flagellar protein FlaG